MRFFLLLTVLSFGLMTGFAEAEYRVVGAGAGSCGTWMEDRRAPTSDAAYLDVSWVLGFLAGTAYEGMKNPLNGMDGSGISAWIDNYCRVHPIDMIAAAAAAFSEVHPR
jgi:hypothetical protein